MMQKSKKKVKLVIISSHSHTTMSHLVNQSNLMNEWWAIFQQQGLIYWKY